MKSRAFAFEFIFRIFLLCAFLLCAQLARATDYIYDASTSTWNITQPAYFQFSSGDSITITGTGEINYSITIPEGVSYIIDSNANVTITGFVTINGSITINGSVNLSGGVESSGNIQITSSGSIISTGTITNSGTITNAGTITTSSDTMSLNNSGTITNTGTINTGTNGTIYSSKEITNSGSGSITTGSFTNAGTVSNTSGASISATTVTNNTGATITNSGTISGSDIRNSGTLTNNGGTINGTVSGSGTYTNVSIATERVKTYYWGGAGDGSSWTDSENWTTDAANTILVKDGDYPGIEDGDTAVFDPSESANGLTLAEAGYTLTLKTNASNANSRATIGGTGENAEKL